MAVRGDLLQTAVTMLDGDDNPITGLAITILASTGPGGSDMDPTRFSQAEEEDGVYILYYQTNDTDLYGEYYVRFQFNDVDETEYETEPGEWALEAERPVPQIIAPWSARTGSNTNVPPWLTDEDGTFDSRYWMRGETPTVGDHVHGDLETLNFLDTASIDFTVSGNDISAAAIFGTTAGTVAEGSSLAAKANTADLADVATTGDYADLLNIPSTFTPASHNHAASEITSGTIDIARIPTGTSGTTVSLGNHTHNDTAAIEVMMDGGGSVVPNGMFTWFRMPWTGTITAWNIYPSASATIQLDVWKGTHAQWPLNVSHTITGGHTQKPQLASQTVGSGTNFSAWTSTVFAIDELVAINVDASPVNTMTKGLLVLRFTRTIA